MKFRTALALFLCIPAFGMTPDRRTYVEHKAAHALVGIAVYKVGKHYGHPKAGLAVAWGLGIAKELYDRKHGGKFRPGDVAWTGAPATVTFAVRW